MPLDLFKKILYAILFVTLLHPLISHSQDMGWFWAKQFGELPGQYTQSNAIATDKRGNIYITGTAVGNLDLFIAKYDSMGNRLWIKWPGRGIGYGVVTDANNNVYITGHFADSLVFGSDKLYDSNSAMSGNFFIVKCDPQGNFLWGLGAGENYHETGRTIAIDLQGNLIVGGEFQSAVFTLGNTTLVNHGPPGTSDSFLLKLNSFGNILWAKSSGGRVDDTVRGVTSDRSGNVIASGEFHSAEMNFEGTKLINSNATEDWKSSDIFICKYDPSGNFIWARHEGNSGENQDRSNDVTADSQGNIYITGAYSGSYLTIGSTVLTNSNSGINNTVSGEYFVAKYDPSGNSLWAKNAKGSDGVDEGVSIDIDVEDNIYVLGFFGNGSTQIRFDEVTLVLEPGLFQSFVVKYNAEGEVLSAISTLGGLAESSDLDVNKPNSVLVTGIFETTVRFGSASLSSSEDSFIAKLEGCKYFPPPMVTADRDLTACKGDTISLSTSTASSYFWSTGESSQTVKVIQSGEYFVRVLDLSGCLLTSDSATVNIIQPQATITVSSKHICRGKSATLVANTSEYYLWSTGEVTQAITITQPGNYYVKITDLDGCSNTSPTILINEIPSLSEIQLQSDCERIFTTSDYLLTWYKDNEVFNSDIINRKQIQPADSGYYFAATNNECETKQSNVVHFVPPKLTYIFIPNVFTPNGDQYNECFVLGNKLMGSVLTVLNRWGSVVYHSQDYESNWNGGNLANGTYFYVIQNRCFSEEIKGIVTIVR